MDYELVTKLQICLIELHLVAGKMPESILAMKLRLIADELANIIAFYIKPTEGP